VQLAHLVCYPLGGCAGEAPAISEPPCETAVLKHFQERMPYGLFVPDVGEP
jgi:hypothetical protein